MFSNKIPFKHLKQSRQQGSAEHENYNLLVLFYTRLATQCKRFNSEKKIPSLKHLKSLQFLLSNHKLARALVRILYHISCCAMLLSNFRKENRGLIDSSSPHQLVLAKCFLSYGCAFKEEQKRGCTEFSVLRPYSCVRLKKEFYTFHL